MPLEDGNYRVCEGGDQPIGGTLDISGAHFEGVPAQCFADLAVDDVDARVAQASVAGAELIRPLFDVPGVGRIAIVQDPTSAVLGWITPASQ